MTHAILRYPRGFGLFMLCSLLLFGCGNKPRTQERNLSSMFDKEGTLTILNADAQPLMSIDIEIAETPQERETGMMGRPALGEKHGMLFIFEQEQHLSFWMMNTMIPLDMLFINSDKEIVTIHRSAVPFSKDSYAADAPGQYVLEVNGGFCDRFGVVEGMKVEWKRTDD